MTNSPRPPRISQRIPGSLDFWLLAFLLLFTAVAVLGYGVFGLRPGALPDSDAARWLYRESFAFFARGQIVVTFSVLALVLSRRVGIAWVAAAGAVAAASFVAEHVGTGYGIPFGAYRYTGLLGWKLLGRVPVLIPLSWFAMALASFALARRHFPQPKAWSGRILLGAWLLTSWDLALDPAMSHLTAYWQWEVEGGYYGMPPVNLSGWLLTGLVLMGLLELLGTRKWVSQVSGAWWAGFYGAVLLMPLGMVLAAGLWLAATATAGALALPFIVLEPFHSSRRDPADLELLISEGST